MKGREKYLVDSVIFIDHLNGIDKAGKWLESHFNGEAVISSITLAEVLAGATDEEKFIVKELLDKFKCLSLDAKIADSAAELRRINGWRLPDAFQAAAAIENDLELVTRNTKDFNPAKFDFVYMPYVV